MIANQKGHGGPHAVASFLATKMVEAGAGTWNSVTVDLPKRKASNSRVSKKTEDEECERAKQTAKVGVRAFEKDPSKLTKLFKRLF